MPLRSKRQTCPRKLTIRVDATSIEEAGYDAAVRLLVRNEPFDAIVAASDLIAIGAMRALQEAGRRVPEDVVVTGLTTFSQPGSRIRR